MLGLLDLLGSQVCLVAQEPPEFGVKEQLKKGKCGALVVDVAWYVLGPTWSRRNRVSSQVTLSDQPVLRFSAEASSGSESLNSKYVSSSEG